MNQKVICVYCASSEQIKSIYLDAAKELGRTMAKKGIGCVFGAGKVGLMGALSDTLIKLGGCTIGVIPKFMMERGWGREDVSRLIITESMHERKETMMKLSDGAIALPGGCGTMEELMEVITWKQLGLYKKPFVILNINNYYGPLLEMLDKAIAENFLPQREGKKFWEVAKNIDEAIMILQKAFETTENKTIQK